MSKFKLTYFDINAGRGEPIRMAAVMGGIDFEDNRISFEEFSIMRAVTPLNSVPTLEVDGVVYTQSIAMYRLVGKQAGLYPLDDWEAFKCDEILCTLDDASIATGKTFGLEGDDLRAAREALVTGPFTRTLRLLGTRLRAAGGEYFTDNRLTVADLKAFVWLRSIGSGVLDHVPTDLTTRIAPELVNYAKNVASNPAVADYLSKLDK